MPRNKAPSRAVSEVCSDCGAPDSNWASVNRGVLMCNDCASVHMGLGRHISQVKHLTKSSWHQNMLNMVKHLVSAGANLIWEHSLLDPAQMRSGKRKPNPSDHTHPTKAEFIKSKYVNLMYVHRLPCREEEHNTTHDFSKQLHSSVRTGNLETSLRLLSLGAQANFFNPEKGNTPLHVAAKVGQSLQVELLVAYGADPSARDSNDKTPEDLARAENHNDLADRLVELQYELSDRFTEFVCQKTPDHKAGFHYIIPKTEEIGMQIAEGRRRLQALNNQTFEELAMDVFDEVDRRELEIIWQDAQKSILIVGKGANPGTQSEVVPFLPLNPEYSTTRNQGRQKLAVFKDSEFKNLISDLMIEIARRQEVYTPPQPQDKTEDPIYDVPPDDDLDYQTIEKSIDPPKETVPKEEFFAVKQKLENKEAECTKLQEMNRELSLKVTNLAKQNHELTKKMQNLLSAIPQLSQNKNLPEFSGSLRLGPHSPSGRPTSFYNPNDSSGSQSSLHSGDSENRRRTIHIDHPVIGGTTTEDIRQALNMPPTAEERDVPPSQGSAESDYDNNGTPKSDTKGDKAVAPEQSIEEEIAAPSNNVNANNNLVKAPLAVQEVVEPAGDEPAPADQPESKRSSGSPTEGDEAPNWPDRSSLMRRTDLLTRNIQTLRQSAQGKKTESYFENAESILSAVNDVVALFDKPHSSLVKSVLQSIQGSALKLRNRCKEASEQKNRPENHKQLTEEIIAHAYEIAKAEKQLVTMAPREEDENSSSS